MHPPSERSAENNTGAPIEAHPLELRPALLAVTGDLADSDLVADHLHWLGALGQAPGQTITVNISILFTTEFPPHGSKIKK